MPRRSVGPAAWLIDDVAEPAAWAASLRALRLDGVHEIVPAERTVLVVCERALSEAIGGRLDEVAVAPSKATSAGATVTIDTVYDGADLASVARATGLTVDEVIDRHVHGVYSVAFCGFSPGFAYMTGLDPVLHLDRRPTPRTRVPAGSVAIAAGYSCVYPTSSPGGWHLLGRSEVRVFDARREEPALLRPGMTVSFVEVAP